MNKEIANFIKELKTDFKPRKTDTTIPVSCWSEKDLLNNKIIDAFVIILKTRGCSWAFESGCSMCGYFNDSLWSDVSDKELLKQFESALKKYKGEKFVKITQKEYPPGIIGPFALQGAIAADKGKEEMVVFDVSMRIPGSPLTMFTPHSGYLYGQSISYGERIAMEIKKAITLNKLKDIVS